MVVHILYNDCLWCVDNNKCFGLQLDLGVKGQGQIYIKCCMDCNTNHIFFDGGYLYLRQYLPEGYDKKEFVFQAWLSSRRSKPKYLNSGCMACNEKGRYSG